MMIEIDNILDVEKYINDVDAVIFDLDDTLYSEKDYVRSGFSFIAEYFDIPMLELELWNSFEQGKKPIDDVFEKRKMIEKKDRALQIYRMQNPKIQMYSGTSEMLERIKILNKKIGIITDGRPEGQRAKIKALGLESIFDKIIITDELGGPGFRKPNSEAFILMQRALEVSFEKMVYIGDNIEKDFIAPHLLGMKQIHYNNLDGIYTI